MVRLSPLLLLSLMAAAPAETMKTEHVSLTYAGLSEAQAQSIAKVLETARRVYIEDFGFDMPEMIQCQVTVDRAQRARLYTDGKDRVTLVVPSADKLRKPSVSRQFTLYGLCHELGHIGQYRVLKERDWLTGAAAEGFAHYAGSHVVDRVYAIEGEKLWQHDPYDYRGDGMSRLKRQLTAATPDEVTRAAGRWQGLIEIIGAKKLPELFSAWSQREAKADVLLAKLVELNPEKRDALTAWWKEARALFVQEVDASGFARVTAPAAKLSGKPLTLVEDDDMADGKRSIAGSGHARRFATPGEGVQWYLTAVSIHAGRYGPVRPPDTRFSVILCDKQRKPIASYDFPYAALRRAQPQWQRLELPTPTLVPGEFQIVLRFNPTASSGVYLSFDSSTSGHSQTALPGRAGAAMKDGDWMIRPHLDQLKEANALE